jgi:hypothetical protein
MNRFTPIFLCASLLAGTGCRSLGPKTIPRDRYDYSGSISESWKRQTLLNIVKLRYCDPPVFVDVGQIVAGYSLETSAALGGQVSSLGALQGNSLNLGGAAKYTDRPTITYTPLTGDKFVKALMTPLTPESVFFTIESGWPADAILFLTTKRLNRLRNQEASIAGLVKADPRFLRALELLRKLQDADALGMRIEQDLQKRQSTLVTFYAKDISESALADSRELRQLLGLAADATEFKLLFGAVPANDRELAMQTRSLLHILTLLAAQVVVPAEHVAQGLASPGIKEANKEGPPAVSFVRILSSKNKPAAPYVAVQYRDYWFWIEDTDLKSKRTFAFMMLLFTLGDTGAKEIPPLITIPAQ